MKGFYRIGVMAALATVSAVALSQGAGGPPSPEAQAKSAIETRQGLFKVIANQNGPMGAMMRGQREVDTALVTQRMERIKVLSEIIPEVFALDTRQYKDTKTAALDGIWNSQADFKSKAEALGKAADAVLAVSKTGDKEATAKALRDNIGKGCSGCHDNYRAKP
jgi:cytochrome c556